MPGTVLRLDDARRTYHLGKVDVPALRGVSLSVEAGEAVAIVGPSGSGKTTLLNLAGLLDHADGGEVFLGDEPTSKLNERTRARYRRTHIGFVFQSFNLIPHLTAEENVALPLRYADSSASPLDPRALLERVGLAERAKHKPDELSGGEQQRVAIARSLVLNPPLLLADEPTGELDSETAGEIHTILERLRKTGKAVVVVTHNPDLAHVATRVVHMRDGVITDEVARPRPKRKATRKRAPARKKT